jgi:hypothetical protein
VTKLFGENGFVFRCRLTQIFQGFENESVKSYAKAIKAGSKYVYQTVPRILTIWLDLAEDEEANKRDQLNEIVSKAIRELPAYKVQ